MNVKKIPQPNEGKGELVTPTPSKIDLRNANAIRLELASVYRDMRFGNIETADGTKLAYVLDQIRKAYETSVLEQRLKDIEQTLGKRV